MAEHDSSLNKSDQERRSQLLEQFDDIFTCAICLMKLDDPRLCPQCSKLYCYDCISEWLQSEAEQHLYCPNCKYELQLDKLVKVRWFEEAEKLKRNCIEPSTSTSSNEQPNGVNEEEAHSSDDIVKKDICSTHLKEINFYCCTCKSCVCDICAVADENHVDHTFKSLELIYSRELQIVEEEFEKVVNYIEEIEPLVDEVERNMELVEKMRKEKFQEVESYAKNTTKEVNRQVNDTMQKLENHKSALTAGMKDIEQSLELMKEEVKTSNRLQFIAKKSRIVKECNKILQKPIKHLKEVRVPIYLKIEIPVIFENGIFVIENFPPPASQKHYSQEFSDSFGHIWRFMYSTSNGQLGIYLKLVEGFPCTTEYRLQLSHPDPERIIKREFTSPFDRSVQSAWGYRDFAALETILNDGYLKDDDSLELMYHIRPRGGIDSGSKK